MRSATDPDADIDSLKLPHGIDGKPSAELLSEDPDDLDRRVADARSAWAQALSLAKNGGKFVEGFGKYALKFATQLANFRRNPPKQLLQGKNEQERK